MPDLEIHLLGPFEVICEGQLVIAFKSDKARALLAYLVCEVDRPQPRGELAGLFWPGYPVKEGLDHLDDALSSLEDTLNVPQTGPHYILIHKNTVQFNPNSNCRVDLWDLRQALADGSIQKLKSGLSLYRSRFLEDFSLEDCPAFDAWLSSEGKRIQQEVILGFYRLATHYEERGDYDMALFAVEQVREIDPFGEDSCHRMMQLLALNGQRELALDQYHLCCKVLRNELRVEPSREIRQLYKAIRSKSFPPRPSGPRWDTLPHQTTPFIGREAALIALGDLLTNPEIPLVTIRGPGGIGKTRLALQVAMAHRTYFRDGVYFISLGSLNDPEQIVPAIAAATGFYFFRGAEGQETQLFNYLRDKSMLLVIDNIEHLSAGAPFIADLQHSTRGLRVLATSRDRLNLSFETVFTLDGMDWVDPEGAPETDLIDMLQPEAVQLFIQCARRVDRDFEMKAGDLAHIQQICELVGGSPLGIVLVAPWVSSLPISEIAIALQQDHDLLTSQNQDLMDQQTILRAVFNHSWKRLSTREQDILVRLAVFKGGFTFQAAQEITGAILTDLMELERKALIQYSFEVGRYEFHNLTWQFVFERLSALPLVHHSINVAHSSWYISILRTWFSESQGSRQLTTLQLIEWDIENIRAAWDWEIARGHTLNLERALNGLCFYYQWRGQYQDGETLCFLTSQRLRQDLPPSAPRSAPGFRLLARVLAWRSLFSLAIGHQRRAHEYLAESMQVFDLDAQDGFYLRQVGDCLVGTSWQEARRYYETSLAMCREAEDCWGEAHALAALGWAAFDSGSYSEARESFAESLALLRKLRDHIGMTNALRGLGSIAVQQGQLAEAEAFMREWVQLVKETRNQAEMAKGLSEIGWILVLNGNFQDGCTSVAESIEIWTGLGAEIQAFSLHTPLGLAELHQGSLNEALDEIQQGLELAQDTRLPKALAHANWGLGLVYLSQDDLKVAWASALKCEQIWGEAGYLEEIGHAKALQATIACRQGHLPQARDYLVSALENVVQHHVLLPLLYAVPALDLYLKLQDKPVMRTRIHTLAASYPLITRSYYFKVVTQQLYASQNISHEPLGGKPEHSPTPSDSFLKLAVELLEALS